MVSEKRRFSIFVTAIAFLSLFMVQNVYAQEASAVKEGEKAVESGAAPKGSKAPARGQVLNLDATLVEGKIQKPEAFYLLEDAGLEHDETPKRQNFLVEIIRAVKTE